MTTETTIDAAKAQAFAGNVISMLNGTSLTLLISVGHEVGLFDRMATLSPSTCEEIAAATSLNERYVREWLGAMTVGKIIEYDPTTRLNRSGNVGGSNP